MFKKIVEMITAIETKKDLSHVCGEIDRAYQSEKITAKDNEILYKLVGKIGELKNF